MSSSLDSKLYYKAQIKIDGLRLKTRDANQ